MNIEQIGRFKVLDALGSGAFARVYQVIHPITKDVLALKWLLPIEEMEAQVRSSYAEFYQRFIEDARTLVRLRSLPGVVQVFDIGEAEGRPYYTMELLGESLADLFGEVEEGEARTLAVEELLGYVLQVVQTLVAVHGEGVIHRDIKPANVLLEGAVAKLSDFGLAKRSGGSRMLHSHSRMGMGSDHYSAPEQEFDASRVDHRADLFSVGVLLYRGLTGKYPAHTRFCPVSRFRADVPEALVLLIDELMEEVEARPGSAEEVLARLEGIACAGAVPVLVAPSEASGVSIDLAQVLAVPPSPRGSQAGDVFKEEIYPGVEMGFCYIPPGKFWMGAPKTQEWSPEEVMSPVHVVAITRGFFLGQYVVTQAQWEGVMGTRPWSGKMFVVEAVHYPAAYVSWEDAQAFLQKLNERAGEDCYRLPSEAQWEYACRAGTRSVYYFGDDASELDAYGWYDGDSIEGAKLPPVGEKRANGWGLYDMHGLVWEWCQDRWGYSYYEQSPPCDPPGPESGHLRVVRGGSWYNTPSSLRAASRGGNHPGNRINNIGFRCAMSLKNNDL